MFQTVDRGTSWTEAAVAGPSPGPERESWAWSSGKKWSLVSGGTKQKLNLYTAPPSTDLVNSAAPVRGGLGEKMMQRMGWREGEGLGKGKHGTVDLIELSKVKTDRRGLTSQEDVGGRDLERESPEEVKERSKAKFAAMKSSSFWSWHVSGMKGPENSNTRIKLAKKESKQQHRADTNIDLTGKHPVSALLELCHKRGWREPRFSEEPGVGGFRFRVEVEGVTYSTDGFCDNKKSAKRECASHCLVKLGLLSS